MVTAPKPSRVSHFNQGNVSRILLKFLLDNLEDSYGSLLSDKMEINLIWILIL